MMDCGSVLADCLVEHSGLCSATRREKVFRKREGYLQPTIYFSRLSLSANLSQANGSIQG